MAEGRRYSPPSPLQKAPTGLLEALDLKTLAGGKNPDAFCNELTPNFDVRQYYLQNLLGQANAAATITAGNIAGATLTVPANSLWRLRNVAGGFTSTVANTPLAGHIELRIPQLGAAVDHVLVAGEFPQTQTGFSTVAYRAKLAWQPTMDFFVPGGSLFQIFLVGGVANDVTTQLRVLFEELGQVRPA